MARFNPYREPISQPTFFLLVLLLGVVFTPSASVAASLKTSCQVTAGASRILCSTDNPAMAEQLVAKTSTTGAKVCRATVNVTEKLVEIAIPMQWARVLISATYTFALDVGWVDSLCGFLEWLFDGGQTAEATSRIQSPQPTSSQDRILQVTPASDERTSQSEPPTAQASTIPRTIVPPDPSPTTRPCNCSGGYGSAASGYFAPFTSGYGQYLDSYRYRYPYGYVAPQHRYGYRYVAPRYYGYYRTRRYFYFRHR